MTAMTTLEFSLYGASAIVGAIIGMWLLSRIVGAIRGRNASERAKRNFAQARIDKREEPKREQRRRLVMRFFGGCWRGLLRMLGIVRKAPGAASRVVSGPSMRATAVSHRPPSGRVNRVSRRIGKTVVLLLAATLIGCSTLSQSPEALTSLPPEQVPETLAAAWAERGYAVTSQAGPTTTFVRAADTWHGERVVRVSVFPRKEGGSRVVASCSLGGQDQTRSGMGAEVQRQLRRILPR